MKVLRLGLESSESINLDAELHGTDPSSYTCSLIIHWLPAG